MILGLFFRNYKSYSNLNFVPITNSPNNPFSMFVGINGVGKSSILEALNAFFNDGYWNRTKGGKQDDTFIAPLFLIEKSSFNSLLDLTKEKIRLYEYISDYFLEIDSSYLNSTEIKNFFNFRQDINKLKNDYYFMAVGCSYKERGKTYFGGTFHNDLLKKIQSMFGESKEINFIIDDIREYYSYIYIPVESKIDDVVKLETSEMQKLMDTNILEEIDKVVSNKSIRIEGAKGHKSVINIINDTLDKFMSRINLTIQDIDKDYSFKTDEGYKKNLTASDLRDKILEAYFSIRTLKKDRKEIFELSSGEQRIALIDIATAFIENQKHRSGNLILAIDEPESSLHISRCFDQFKRLQYLSQTSQCQVLITTHWYGSIPILQRGTLNHIEYDINKNKVKINQFSLSNYLEYRRDFPDDIHLKSYFELISTIISSIKAGKNKWLIVEGADDLTYFSYYMNNKIKDLIILPVGGAGNVIKIYEFLLAPFMENIEKGVLKEAKILCLIDTDREQKSPRMHYKKVEKSLCLKRLQNNNGTITLETTEQNGMYIETTIEDCLDSNILYTSIQAVFEDRGDLNFNNLYEFSREADKGLKKTLQPKNTEGYKEQEDTINTIRENSFKVQLSEHYCKNPVIDNKIESMPKLFQLVYAFYQ